MHQVCVAAFQLHQRKYDVWLANLRGMTPYGRHHLELTDVMSEFWRYSFHEHGAYDLPAIIDHIMERKAREGLQQTPAEEKQGEEEENQGKEEDKQGKEEATQQPLEAQKVLLIGHSQVNDASTHFLLLNSRLFLPLSHSLFHSLLKTGF